MNGNYLAERSVALGNGLKKLASMSSVTLKSQERESRTQLPIRWKHFIPHAVAQKRAAAYGKYFADRNVSLDERKEKLKGDVKKVIEGYNKLPFRQKMYITAGLIAGGAAASFAGLPALHAISRALCTANVRSAATGSL